MHCCCQYVSHKDFLPAYTVFLLLNIVLFFNCCIFVLSFASDRHGSQFVLDFFSHCEIKMISKIVLK